MSQDHAARPGNVPVQSGPRRASLPAWVLSVMVHLLFLSCLLLLLRRWSEPAGSEPERRVSIVLARHNAPKEVDYFDGASESSAGQTSADGDAAPSLLGQPALPLPEESLARLLPAVGGELALPQNGSIATGADIQARLPVPSLVSAGRARILPGLSDEEIIAADRLNAGQAKPMGPPVRLTLFGSVTASGRRFVFLIDRSKSMGGDGLGALAAAERELVEALTRLGPTHRFQIIAYNHKPTYLRAGDMTAADPESQTRAGRFLAGLIAYGSTEHEMALRAALRQEPDAIFLLTDAGEPPPSRGQLQSIVDRANDGRTSINCVLFGSGPPSQADNFLRQLAAQCRGSYAYVDMLHAGPAR